MRFKIDLKTSAFLLAVILIGVFAIHVIAQAGGNKSKEKASAATSNGKGAVTVVVRAERTIEGDAGQFTARLERVPSDPRAGETSLFALHIAEKVEGGFGGGRPVAIEDASVSLNVTSADGKNVAENLSAKFEKGFYRTSYAFGENGNYKIVFNVTTSDKRKFLVDFPVTVVNSPINRTFLGWMIVLSLLTAGTLGAVYMSARKSAEGFREHSRKLAPVAVAAILLFALGTFALAYFAPPRSLRAASDMPLVGTDPNGAPSPETTADALQTTLTVPKESQILFGIKTESVSTRQITSGLKTTGVVRARPDARGVVVPPVAGRIVLRAGLTLGSAVGRGEQIGSVEQILDVSGQTELESQRLEVEAQQREIEARRLELRNTSLALQSQQAQQRAAANQTRTRLAQAKRELRRSENLLEVGAAPRKRVEEALTAVRVAEQEITSADQQVKILGDQIRAAQTGQNVFRAPRVNQPTRAFPLTAPVTGIISEIKATSGQISESGAELLSIVNLTTVLLEAQVFERDLPIVRESSRASFTSSSLSGEVYTIGTPEGDGRLVSIGQSVDPQTRTVAVIYEVKNPLQRLRDGNFVEITIDTSGETKVIAVPKNSIINEQGQTFVFVFTGGEMFERRLVKLGAEGADFFEVKTGLKTGERVVTEGIYQLRATQPAA
jgi:multidrug resistance efflux pump